VGRVYQQTAIDTYSKVGFAKLYDRKTALTAADTLNDRVIPFFDEHGLRIDRVLTDRGTEYCGAHDRHEYELYLAVEDIDHTRTRTKSPQTNGICERFHKTLLDEFYRVAFRKKVYRSIEELQADGQLTASFTASLTQGLAALGRCMEAMAMADSTLDLVRSDGPASQLPELLRVKGIVLLSMPRPRPADAEALFIESLACSRRQGARAWELRTSIDLAKLWAAQGRRHDACALLGPALAMFSEGFDTADLVAARQSLAGFR
jgi:transposase InsO family protein